MVVPAERSGVDVAFSARLGKPACRVVVSFKRPGRAARAVVDVAVGRETPILGPESAPSGSAWSATTAAIIDIAVIEGGAVREVPLVVVNSVVVVPVVTPVAPAPPEPAEEADTEACAEEEVRSAIPNSRIGIPARPGDERQAVHEPWIIGGYIDDIGSRGLNDDRGTLSGYILLRRGAQVAGLFRFLAHHLDGVRHVLLLVVIRIAQGGRPGEVLVHVAEHGGKRGQGLDAGVPRLLIDGLPQSIALQDRMILHPAIGFDNLFRK